MSKSYGDDINQKMNADFSKQCESLLRAENERLRGLVGRLMEMVDWLDPRSSTDAEKVRALLSESARVLEGK